MSENKEVIQDLTPEQESKLENYYEKWLEIGLQARSTTAKDRSESEQALKDLYKQEGLKEPSFIWVKSPIAAVKKCLEMGDKKDGLVGSAGYGSHDANWLGFYEFMMNEIGLIEECKDLIPKMTLAKHCGWYWPYENVCIISEVPTDLHVNENGDLHNFNGPALSYSDGESLYFFNGIKVTEELAKKKESKFTKQDIIGEENADICREVCKKLGQKRVEKLLGSTLIDTYKTKLGGKYELLSINYDKRGERPFLRMTCPSSKDVYLLGVKPGTTKAKDGYEQLNNNYKIEDTEYIWES